MFIYVALNFFPKFLFSSPTQTSGGCKVVIPRSRTNFKQELMREQSILEEKRQGMCSVCSV